jgi:hypothetical protein
LLSKKKTQTQTDLFWDRVAFYKTYLNKIPIVSVIKKKNKKKNKSLFICYLFAEIIHIKD